MPKYPIEEKCEHCDSIVRTYRRKFPKGDLLALASLLRMHRKGNLWVHVSDLEGKTGGGDFAKYKHWGLIEERPLDDGDKRTSGMWRLTVKGKAFIDNEINIPSHAIMRNGKVLSFDGSYTTMKNMCHSAGFSYAELMGRKELA